MPDLVVFTGDLVGSQQLPSGGIETAFNQLTTAAAVMTALSGVPARLTRSRGDGWQAVSKATFALRAGFLLRAAVRKCGKGFDTRIGLGVGEGEILSDTLDDAAGPVFVASGAALDTMAKHRRLTGAPLPPALAVALPLADRLSGDWTPRQAEIAMYALSHATPSQDATAKGLGLTQQNTQKIWAAADLDAVVDACAVYEQILAD